MRKCYFHYRIERVFLHIVNLADGSASRLESPSYDPAVLQYYWRLVQYHWSNIRNYVIGPLLKTDEYKKVKVFKDKDAARSLVTSAKNSPANAWPPIKKKTSYALFAHFVFEEQHSGLGWAISDPVLANEAWNRYSERKHMPSVAREIFIFLEF